MRTFLFVCLSLITFNSISQNISQWRGINRDGIYNETGLLSSWPEGGPKMVWYHDSIPKGYASAVIANNMVYTTGIEGDKDVVIAFDINGNLKWKVPFGNKWVKTYSESRGTPTIEGDKLYVLSGMGEIACLNALSGTIIWQVKAQEIYSGVNSKFGISESLLIVDDKVIYTPAGEQTTVVALNKNTGDLIWKSESIQDQSGYTSPLLISREGKKIITQVTEDFFIGVAAKDGEILWKFNFGEYASPENGRKIQTNTPLYRDGEFFLTSGYNHKSVMLKLAKDNRSLTVNWVDTILDVHHGGVVEIDGYIYGANWEGNRKGNWVCLDWKTGKQMYNTEWINKGSIISAENMLYCYEEKTGNLAIVPATPDKFEVAGSLKVPYGSGPHWAHPVINNGLLYVRHGNALMVYDIKK